MNDDQKPLPDENANQNQSKDVSARQIAEDFIKQKEAKRLSVLTDLQTLIQQTTNFFLKNQTESLCYHLGAMKKQGKTRGALGYNAALDDAVELIKKTQIRLK